jgi:hypothetical protein
MQQDMTFVTLVCLTSAVTQPTKVCSGTALRVNATCRQPTTPTPWGQIANGHMLNGVAAVHGTRIQHQLLLLLQNLCLLLCDRLMLPRTVLQMLPLSFPIQFRLLLSLT